MALEAERIGRYERHQRKKHLVAAALPNTSLSTKCSPSGNVQFTNWVSKSIPLIIGLLSTWLFQYSQSPHPATVDVDTSAALSQLASQIAATNSLPCSGHGYMADFDTERSLGICKCYECFGGVDCSQVIDNCVIDLDHGDPTMFEEFWFRNAANTITVILGYQRMSYFAQSKHVWFMENELEVQIRELHRVVGNAVTEGRHIVVGTGSTQLFQATLYALTSSDQSKPTNIVSAAPFYSSYPAVTDYLRSALFKWAGDAVEYNLGAEHEEPYIEMVCSPNNPDGRIQHAVVNGTGHVVHDLAYYWPHYTPITGAADHAIMLFTLSKSTGHAGTRIGWAILKDERVAKKMTKFLELNTIGVSHDSQVRATQVIKAVIEGSPSSEPQSGSPQTVAQHSDNNKLFHFGNSVMHYRWKRLREALNGSSAFSIPGFQPSYCTFFQKDIDQTPAFAWLRCKKTADCQAFLKERRIITRSGRHFGAGAEFVRLSMLERNQKFEMLVDRLARVEASRTPD